MTNENSLILLNQKSGNVKNTLVQKLSKQWPMSAKQLSNTLQREYALNISYQAVHKALQELEKEKIVEKNEKGYQLDEEWIQNVLQISQSIAQNYARNEPLDFDREISHLTFHSWVNMGRFGGITFKGECPNPENKPTIMAWQHVWPVSTVSIEESKKLVLHTQHNVKYYCISPNNTPLDQVFNEWIKQLGYTSMLGAKLPLDYDFIIQGDTIAQFYYENDFRQKLNTLYQKTTEIKNIGYQKLQELATEKTNIHVIILRNKALAEAKRNEILQLFNKSNQKNVIPPKKKGQNQ
jgi:biotin operon repressor